MCYLYSENKPRELSPAPGWPYKSKHQLKTVPGHAAGQGPGRCCRSGLGRLEQDKPIQRYTSHPCQRSAPRRIRPEQKGDRNSSKETP